VTVNAVLPGPTWTEGLDGYVGETARNNGIDDAEMERLSEVALERWRVEGFSVSESVR
jgi:hypothetical protein